jgi:hypothetical protein
VALSEYMLPLPSKERELTTFRPGRCPRCQGFMVLVRYEDWGSTTTNQAFLAWDCVQCGAVIDPVILANRARGLKPPGGRARLQSAM